jgi:hypothetical protein
MNTFAQSITARPRSPGGAYDVFICCTAAEANEARSIRQMLEDCGIRCALTSSGLRPGHQPVMILVLTRNTVESEAIELEVARAVYRGLPLLVLRLENVNPNKKLAYYLSHASRPTQRLDAIDLPLDQNVSRLVQHIELALGYVPGWKVEASQPVVEASYLQATEVSTGLADVPRSPPTNPERIGYFCYSPTDVNVDISRLHRLLARFRSELEIQFNSGVQIYRSSAERSSEAFTEEQMRVGIAAADFFVPLVTSAVLATGPCDIEYRSFLEREASLGRRDLIFPLMYGDVPELGGDAPANDPKSRLIAERGWFDWRHLRDRPVTSPEVARDTAEFCGSIARRLQRKPSSLHAPATGFDGSQIINSKLRERNDEI